jgi:hypothetical protein
MRTQDIISKGVMNIGIGGGRLKKGRGNDRLGYHEVIGSVFWMLYIITKSFK